MDEFDGGEGNFVLQLPPKIFGPSSEMSVGGDEVLVVSLTELT